MPSVSRLRPGWFAELTSLPPDTSRAIRATVAFMVPLLLSAAGWLPVEMSFVAIAAQNIAMLDVRGDYRLRLALVLVMTLVFSGAAALGAAVSGSIFLAVFATLLIAASGGAWRHLSSDYGASFAISSTLVFLIALASPDGAAAVGRHSFAALVGGLWGVTLQVANWPFRPQHPLRRAVSDSWLAVANLFDALTPDEPGNTGARHDRVVQGEVALRTALDTTYATLAAARAGRIRERLEALNLAAARLATRVVALNTALETLSTDTGFATLAPALEPALAALANTARTVAVAVVSRQPAHLKLFEVRLRRLKNLSQVLRARITAHPLDAVATAQLGEILRQIDEQLPVIHQALRATIERAEERTAISLELLDLRNLTLRPLASALNLSWQVDPALVRFIVRVALLMVFGVVVFKTYALPHGYWLPFTMVVVLQPDYGSTRQRAAQRVLGTFAGSALASALMWLRLPAAALVVATAGTIFAFGFFVKRNYAVAVFFITLFIVLLTEANGPVSLAFTVERLASTMAGGALALLAALFFWPVWERNRFPSILANALRANRDFVRILADRLASGGKYDAEAIAVKRRAESANSATFSSLQRMTGDPKNQQQGVAQAATLANGNQRLTRALTGLALHLTPGEPMASENLDPFAQLAREALDAIVHVVEGGPAENTTLLLVSLENFAPQSTDPVVPRHQWVFAQLTRAATELSAMLLAAGEPASEASAETMQLRAES